MLVFRDERRSLSFADLGARVRNELERRRAEPDADAQVLPALLCSGELECAVLDHGGNAAAAQMLTDLLARAFVVRREQPDRARLAELLQILSSPERVEVKRPEGYAYYALDPYSYARLAFELAPRRAVVIGVRSIGTSLSAIVAQALELRGATVARCTVRPSGHAWARTLAFEGAERALVLSNRESDAEFIIVDEGPGLSGSTLLAVAEALLSLGIATRRIRICCSHTPDPGSLVAPDAAARWARFEVRAADSALRPDAPDSEDVSGGAWRARVFATPNDYPACWVSQERTKFLDSERQLLHKFEGLPPYGDTVYEHAGRLWEAGLCPEPLAYRNGFVTYRWLAGSLLRARSDESVLERLAHYFRTRRRLLEASETCQSSLENMARVNVRESLGIELPASFRLLVDRPVVPDARMLPHEWIEARDGSGLVKVDAVDHGDGHLFPGPTDALWDLAGAMIEFRLDAAARGSLLERYAGAARYALSSPLASYLIAYSAFRVGSAHMALLGANPEERTRLERARAYYAAELARSLRASRFD